MTIDEMFPNVRYEKIENEYDNPYTFPYFFGPQGFWYSTEQEPEAKCAEKDLSVYMLRGYLKMVDPDSVPLRGVWYYWV